MFASADGENVALLRKGKIDVNTSFDVILNIIYRNKIYAYLRQ